VAKGIGRFAEVGARARRRGRADRLAGPSPHAARNRSTTRAVDLAENTAGETALKRGGRDLGIRLLQHFADTLPAAAR
jgi:hypothetical protein